MIVDIGEGLHIMWSSLELGTDGKTGQCFVCITKLLMYVFMDWKLINVLKAQYLLSVYLMVSYHITYLFIGLMSA